MQGDELIKKAEEMAKGAAELAVQAEDLFNQVAQTTFQPGDGGEPFVFMFTIFVLAIFVGYYVVWHVTPALHSPLMGVTNAISSVIVVGALIAASPADMSISKIFGFIAVILASINIFGGFIVTQRMLQMFKKKPKA